MRFYALCSSAISYIIRCFPWWSPHFPRCNKREKKNGVEIELLYCSDMTDSVNISTINATCIRDQTLHRLLRSVNNDLLLFVSVFCYPTVLFWPNEIRERRETRNFLPTFMNMRNHVGRNMRGTSRHDVKSARKNDTMIIMKYFCDAWYRKTSMRKNMSRKNTTG